MNFNKLNQSLSMNQVSEKSKDLAKKFSTEADCGYYANQIATQNNRKADELSLEDFGDPAPSSIELNEWLTLLHHYLHTDSILSEEEITQELSRIDELSDPEFAEEFPFRKKILPTIIPFTENGNPLGQSFSTKPLKLKTLILQTFLDCPNSRKLSEHHSFGFGPHRNRIHNLLPKDLQAFWFEVSPNDDRFVIKKKYEKALLELKNWVNLEIAA